MGSDGGGAEGYPRFSVAEMQRRWAALRALLAEQDLVAAVVRGAGRFNRDSLYLTDWPGGREDYVLFPAEGEPCLFVQLYNHVPQARRLSRVADTRWGGARTCETLADLCRERGMAGGRLGLIGEVPYRDHAVLDAALDRPAWVDLTAAWRLRMTVKSGEELERIRTACRLTDASLEALERELRPGLRESDLPAVIEGAYLREGGYAGIHYFSAVPMERPEICVPAQYPSARLIASGDALITEISGGFWGYTGQAHRTFFVGRPPTAAWQALHDVATEAFHAVAAVLRDGAAVADVLDAADRIHAHGYRSCDDLLHGLNQLPPIVRTRRDGNRVSEAFRFRTDMVVVVQPNVITPDERMGLQFGEALRVTATGVERLHGYRREPVVCGL